MMSNSEKSNGSTRGELSRGAQPTSTSVGSERFNKTAHSESSHGSQPSKLSVEEYFHMLLDIFKRRCEICTL